MPLEIKDLAGLSEPLTKLIEVISQGAGAISESFLIRRNADAKAYEIKAISNAVAESRKTLTAASYKAGAVQVLPLGEGEQDALPERVRHRLEFQEAKRQTNLEQVKQEAAEQLGHEAKVSPDPVDSDWISRFFAMAQDVTNEEMQKLWGRILAGEISKPGSFSLRALEILRNMNREDADLFSRAAVLNVNSGGRALIVNPENYTFLQTVYGLSFNEFLYLKDLGLFFETDLTLNLHVEKESNVLHAGHILMMYNSGEPKDLQLPSIGFTRAGEEIIKLVPQRFDFAYLQKIASLLRQEGVRLQYAQVKGIQGNLISFGPLQDLPE